MRKIFILLSLSLLPLLPLQAQNLVWTAVNGHIVSPQPNISVQGINVKIVSRTGAGFGIDSTGTVTNANGYYFDSIRVINGGYVVAEIMNCNGVPLLQSTTTNLPLTSPINLSFLAYCGSSCNASFTAIPDTTQSRLVHFIHTGGSPSSNLLYLWSFGDGTSSTMPYTTLHQYAAAGVYQVRLIVRDTLNNCADTVVQNVAVTNAFNCLASYQAQYSIGNAPVSVQFVNTSLTNSSAAMFQWNFGDGSSSSANSPTHVYTQNGVYAATLVLNDPVSGCSSAFTDTIRIGAVNPCSAAFSYNYVAQSSLLNLFPTGNSAGTLQYTWTIAGLVLNSANPSLTLLPGIYPVCLTVVSATGCSASYCDTLVLQGVSNCNASFTRTVSGTSAPYNVQFTNTSTGYGVGRLINWDFGDNTNSNVFNPSHSYAASGTYIVHLMMMDTLSQCVSHAYDTLVLGSSSSCLSFFQYYSQPSNPYSILFTQMATSATGAPINYTWNFGDGSPLVFTANPSHTYTAPGTYSVCLRIQSGNCMDLYCTNVTIANANPLFSLSGSVFGPSSNSGNQVKVYLFSIANGNWNPIDTVNAVDSSGFFYVFNQLPAGIYSVLTDLTPNSSQSSLFFPTYLGNTTSWMMASIIVVGPGSSPYLSPIQMVPFQALTAGPGSIGGSVLRGNFRVSSGAMANVTVQLLDSAMSPLQKVRSNASGNFSFGNLPLGNYHLMIDWPGISCTPTAIQLTTAQNQVSGIQYTMNRGGITTSISEVQAISRTLVYPNPSQSDANLLLEVKKPGKYTLECVDLAGRNLFTEQKTLDAGTQTWSLPTNEQAKGMYLLRLRSPEGETFTTHWIISGN